MGTQKTYDVVVIGAGVAGALMAYSLARGKISVAIIESGPNMPDRLDLVRRFALTADRSPGAPYRWTKHATALSPETDNEYYVFADKSKPFKSTYERVVGGSTWHWLGNVPRLVPSDFRLKSVYGVGRDWPIGYDDLEPWYCDAEQELGVSGNHEEWNGQLGAKRSTPFPMQEVWPSYGDMVVKKAAEGLVVDGIPVRISTTPQARNSRPYDDRPACAGNSSCVPLCPIGAKYDASVHVKKAKERGVDVFTEHVVRDVALGKSNGVANVTAHARDGSNLVFAAKVVVIAAHAIESARLLLYNGLANSSGQVGRNLMDHLNRFGVIESAQPVYPFRGPPTTSGIDAFRDGAFRRRHAAFRMSLGNDGWGRRTSPEALVQKLVEGGTFGSALRDQVRETSARWLRISSSVEVLPRESNRIELDSDKKDALGVGYPRISFALDEYTRDGLVHADYAMAKVFEAIGYRSKPEFQGINPMIYSGAGHIVGTTRMGASERDSVVDSDCRSHDHRNLFIVGSSVFPTSGTANPTLTVAALALRTAAVIERELVPTQMV